MDGLENAFGWHLLLCFCTVGISCRRVQYSTVPPQQTINMYSNSKGTISSPYHSQLDCNAYSLKTKRPPMHPKMKIQRHPINILLENAMPRSLLS